MPGIAGHGHRAPGAGYAVTCAGAGAVAPADDSALLVLGRFENGQAPEAEDANGAVTVAFRDITGLDSEGITALVETERASRNRPSTANGSRGFRS